MAKPGTGSGEEPEILEEDGPIEAEEQLALADGEERLPWLESEDDYEEPGVDTGRIVAFGAVGALALVKVAAQFPREVEAAAKAREPHRIAFYLYELAAAFHAFWNMGNDDPEKRIILTHDPELTAARLFLASQIGQVIRNGLAILGVQAVEEL